jgi:hypothetical protein
MFIRAQGFIYLSFYLFLMLSFLVFLIFGSADVEKLKKLTLHNCFILTLPEVGNITDEVIPKNIQQFWVRFAVYIV